MPNIKLGIGCCDLGIRFCVLAEALAPVAQRISAPGYGPGGREFESLRARHVKQTEKATISVAFSVCHVAQPRGLRKQVYVAGPLSIRARRILTLRAAIEIRTAAVRQSSL